MNKKIELIRQTLSQAELLLQLAEEANELAIATMNIKNSFSTDNHNNFIEEIADVKLCMDAVGDYLDGSTVSLQFDSKNKLYKSIIMESCNVSKAAIKFRRTIEPKASPTPVLKREAESIFSRRINDLVAYLYIAGYWTSDEVMKIYKEKLDRWVNRLEITKG